MTREEVLALNYWDPVRFCPSRIDFSGLADATVCGHLRISKHDPNLVEVPLTYDVYRTILFLDQALESLFVQVKSK